MLTVFWKYLLPVFFPAVFSDLVVFKPFFHGGHFAHQVPFVAVQESQPQDKPLEKCPVGYQDGFEQAYAFVLCHRMQGRQLGIGLDLLQLLPESGHGIVQHMMGKPACPGRCCGVLLNRRILASGYQPP